MRWDTCRAPVVWSLLCVACIAIWLTIVSHEFAPLPPATSRLRGSTGETSTTRGRHQSEINAADLVPQMPSTVGWVLPEFAFKHEVTRKQAQDVGEKSTVDNVGAHLDFSQKREAESNQGGDVDLEYALQWPERRRLQSYQNSATGEHKGDSDVAFASRRRGLRSFENNPVAHDAVASVSQENDSKNVESWREKSRIEDSENLYSDLALRWPKPRKSKQIEWPDAWRTIGELQEREKKRHKEHKDPDGNGSGVRTHRPFASRRSGADPRFADSRRKLVSN